MGNCFGSDAKSPSAANTRPSSSGITGPSSSKTGSSSTTSTATTTEKLSNTSGSTFDLSTGSGVSIHEAFLEGQIMDAPNLRIFTFGELKSATRNFKPEMVLGEGGFGTVYKGWVDEKTLNPVKSGLGIVVAVKKMKSESMQGLEEWQSEVNFLGRISHPNLVKLLGYCWEDKELLLVYEFLVRGSLENHLFRKGAAFEPLSWDLRLKIAIGAARGLAFLHEAEKQVIYRDFKASNILLDLNFNAKLSDFGLAKNGPTGGVSHITTRIMGTYGYAAPEYVATGHLYVKSDVYGFGVVLLEILTGQRALDPGRPSGQRSLVDWARPYMAEGRKLARIMDPRLEHKYPSKGALKATQLTKSCLAGDPKDRPSMKEVLETLEQIEAIKGRSREKEDAPPLGPGPAHQHSALHPRHNGSTPGARAAHRTPKPR